MALQNLFTFSFRRGKKAGINHTPVKNGSLNFTTDTEEMYVDIDDKRLNISGVKFLNTEAEIRALPVIGDKIYVARDTGKIMAYDSDNGWVYLSAKNEIWEGSESDYESISNPDPSVVYFVNDD